MYYRNSFPSRSYRSSYTCQNCGRQVDRETYREYEGMCGSFCVEEEVDRRIMDRLDRRGY